MASNKCWLVVTTLLLVAVQAQNFTETTTVTIVTTPTPCAEATTTVTVIQTATPCPLAEAYDCTTSGCSAFGVCQSDGTCFCQPGYGGSTCASKVCTTDGILPSTSETLRTNGAACNCDPGWSGVDCQVCTTNTSCSSYGDGYYCNQEYFATEVAYMNCSIENTSLESILYGWPVYATVEYLSQNNSVTFQLVTHITGFNGFTDGLYEQFFCQMTSCVQSAPASNEWNLQCQETRCACYEGAFLCGNGATLFGSSFNVGIVLGQISDASSVECTLQGGCTFTEQTIASLVGPINLMCNFGECTNGTTPTVMPVAYAVNAAAVGGGVGGAFGGVIAIIIGLLVWRNYMSNKQAEKLVEKDAADAQAFEALFTKHDLSFSFADIEYTIGNKDQKRTVVSGVTGFITPGQLMAIMGSSGAGKTTVLDILAHKKKSGKASGTILLNGKTISKKNFKLISGFVDQEDTLLPRLTVRETVRYAALLRLPASLDYANKLKRAEAVMYILGIYNVGDRQVGSKGLRGISGGEKRRLSIACELVTMPAVLFLDEPTSGLDAYSALVVVTALQKLARQTGTTVITTIHQPRSNIFSMFDTLLLLAHGQMMYSGPTASVNAYFASLGFVCPSNYNPADYLIDMLSEPVLQTTSTTAAAAPKAVSRSSSSEENNDNIEMSSHTTIIPVTSGDATAATDEALKEHEKRIADKFLESEIYRELRKNLDATKSEGSIDADASFVEERQVSNGFRKFLILSGRSFKTFYREPLLMVSHVVLAIVAGLLLGGLFWHVDNSLAGVQNRLGFIFFVLAIFAFGALSSLELFSTERQLFVAERSNGYYRPLAYYASKVLFDTLPLRVFPPIILASISYFMIGFKPDGSSFFKFILVLVLFNLTAGSFVLFYGALFKNMGVASLLASLGVLFSMLFNGFLLNKSDIPPVLNWIQYLSFFNYAFEALIVNELNGVLIVDEAAGINISVSAEEILTKFGFDIGHYWQDVGVLAAFYVGFVILAFLALKFLAVERR